MSPRYLLLSALCCAFACPPVQAQLTDTRAPRPTSLSLQVGNGVVLNRDGPGFSVGLGVERAFSDRWAVRLDAEFAAGDYDEGDWEAIGLEIANDRAYTRSYALTVSSLRTWNLFGADRHQVRAGIGLLARLLEARGVTSMVVPRDVAPQVEGVQYVSVGRDLFDVINLAPQFAYRVALSPRLRAEAFWRYEWGVIEQDRHHQTIFNYNDTGDIRGATYGYYSFVDAQRAMTYGIRVSLGL